MITFEKLSESTPITFFYNYDETKSCIRIQVKRENEISELSFVLFQQITKRNKKDLFLFEISLNSPENSLDTVYITYQTVKNFFGWEEYEKCGASSKSDLENIIKKFVCIKSCLDEMRYTYCKMWTNEKDSSFLRIQAYLEQLEFNERVHSIRIFKVLFPFLETRGELLSNFFELIIFLNPQKKAFLDSLAVNCHLESLESRKNLLNVINYFSDKQWQNFESIIFPFLQQILDSQIKIVRFLANLKESQIGHLTSTFLGLDKKITLIEQAKELVAISKPEALLNILTELTKMPFQERLDVVSCTNYIFKHMPYTGNIRKVMQTIKEIPQQRRRAIIQFFLTFKKELPSIFLIAKLPFDQRKSFIKCVSTYCKKSNESFELVLFHLQDLPYQEQANILRKAEQLLLYIREKNENSTIEILKNVSLPLREKIFNYAKTLLPHLSKYVSVETVFIELVKHQHNLAFIIPTILPVAKLLDTENFSAIFCLLPRLKEKSFEALCCFCIEITLFHGVDKRQKKEVKKIFEDSKILIDYEYLKDEDLKIIKAIEKTLHYQTTEVCRTEVLLVAKPLIERLNSADFSLYIFQEIGQISPDKREKFVSLILCLLPFLTPTVSLQNLFVFINKLHKYEDLEVIIEAVRLLDGHKGDPFELEKILTNVALLPKIARRKIIFQILNQVSKFSFKKLRRLLYHYAYLYYLPEKVQAFLDCETSLKCTLLDVLLLIKDDDQSLQHIKDKILIDLYNGVSCFQKDFLVDFIFKLEVAFDLKSDDLLVTLANQISHSHSRRNDKLSDLLYFNHSHSRHSGKSGDLLYFNAISHANDEPFTIFKLNSQVVGNVWIGSENKARKIRRVLWNQTKLHEKRPEFNFRGICHVDGRAIIDSLIENLKDKSKQESIKLFIGMNLTSLLDFWSQKSINKLILQKATTPTSYHLLKILEFLTTLDDVPSENGLSTREEVFLKITLLKETCQSGLEENLENFYYSLPIETRIEKEKAANGWELLAQIIEQHFQSSLREALSNPSFLNPWGTNYENSADKMKKFKSHLKRQIGLEYKIPYQSGSKLSIPKDLALKKFFEGFLPLDFAKKFQRENIVAWDCIREALFELVPPKKEFYKLDKSKQPLELTKNGILQLLQQTGYLQIEKLKIGYLEYLDYKHFNATLSISWKVHYPQVHAIVESEAEEIDRISLSAIQDYSARAIKEQSCEIRIEDQKNPQPFYIEFQKLRDLFNEKDLPYPLRKPFNEHSLNKILYKYLNGKILKNYFAEPFSEDLLNTFTIATLEVRIKAIKLFGILYNSNSFKKNNVQYFLKMLILNSSQLQFFEEFLLCHSEVQLNIKESVLDFFDVFSSQQWNAFISQTWFILREIFIDPTEIYPLLSSIKHEIIAINCKAQVHVNKKYLLKQSKVLSPNGCAKDLWDIFIELSENTLTEVADLVTTAKVLLGHFEFQENISKVIKSLKDIPVNGRDHIISKTLNFRQKIQTGKALGKTLTAIHSIPFLEFDSIYSLSQLLIKHLTIQDMSKIDDYIGFVIAIPSEQRNDVIEKIVSYLRRFPSEELADIIKGLRLLNPNQYEDILNISESFLSQQATNEIGNGLIKTLTKIQQPDREIVVENALELMKYTRKDFLVVDILTILSRIKDEYRTSFVNQISPVAKLLNKKSIRNMLSLVFGTKYKNFTSLFEKCLASLFPECFEDSEDFSSICESASLLIDERKIEENDLDVLKALEKISLRDRLKIAQFAQPFKQIMSKNHKLEGILSALAAIPKPNREKFCSYALQIVPALENTLNLEEAFNFLNRLDEDDALGVIKETLLLTEGSLISVKKLTKAFHFLALFQETRREEVVQQLLNEKEKKSYKQKMKMVMKLSTLQCFPNEVVSQLNFQTSLELMYKEACTIIQDHNFPKKRVEEHLIAKLQGPLTTLQKKLINNFILSHVKIFELDEEKFACYIVK